MSVWAGFNRGLAAVEERKFNEAQLELKAKADARAEEAFEIDKFKTRATLAAQLKGLYGGGSGSVSGTGSSGTKTSKIPEGVNKNNFQILVQKFSVDPKEVEKLYAAGGAGGIAEAVKLATTYSDKFKTGNYVGDSPDIVIGQMLEGALYTSSETKEYDWDKISNDIGLPLDEELRVMMGDTFVVPGAVSFDTPVLVEKPSLTDLADVEKRAVSNSLQTAKKEKRSLLSRQNKIVELQKTRDLTSIEEQERLWIIERTTQVTSAMESHKDEVYDPLIGLYGSSMGDLLDYYKQFEGAPVGPSFFESSQAIQTVPSRAVALSLMEAEILIPPITVRSLETGKLIKLEE